MRIVNRSFGKKTSSTIQHSKHLIRGVLVGNTLIEQVSKNNKNNFNNLPEPINYNVFANVSINCGIAYICTQRLGNYMIGISKSCDRSRRKNQFR